MSETTQTAYQPGSEGFTMQVKPFDAQEVVAEASRKFAGTLGEVAEPLRVAVEVAQERWRGINSKLTTLAEDKTAERQKLSEELSQIETQLSDAEHLYTTLFNVDLFVQQQQEFDARDDVNNNLSPGEKANMEKGAREHIFLSEKLGETLQRLQRQLLGERDPQKRDTIKGAISLVDRSMHKPKSAQQATS